MKARNGRLKQKSTNGYGTWLKKYFLKKTCREKYSNRK